MIARWTTALIIILFSLPTQAEPIRVAVAANFKPVLLRLTERFEQETAYHVTISSASTGALYNQIINGAPFDLFLSADSLRPQRLEEQGLAIKNSRATYAYGELVLWHHGKKQLTLTDLKTYQGRLAIANPVTAPYGVAAKQLLGNLSLWQSYQGRLVQGASIQQAWQFVSSGNVELGLVAHSQIINQPHQKGTVTFIPSEQYSAIQQDLVILKRSRALVATQAFRTFLLSPASQHYIASQGYRPANQPTKGTF